MQDLDCHLGIKIPQALRERLRVVADGRPVSLVVIRALNDYLARAEAGQ